MATCIVRGTGDVGSAVAHVLFKAGHRVVMHDLPAPSHLRRGMAFADGLFGGVALLENVLAKRARDLNDLAAMCRCGKAIPMMSEEFSALVEKVVPQFVIDARMRKRSIPSEARNADYLTIGLGPNFIAGENVDLAVETAWGDDLGAVVTDGPTRVLSGEPRPIDGVGRERNVYAVWSGPFRTTHKIGQKVSESEVVGVLGEHFVIAPLSGCLRGLTHHGVHVAVGTKIVEVDPRSDPSACFGLGERPRHIALGVLKAMEK